MTFYIRVEPAGNAGRYQVAHDGIVHAPYMASEAVEKVAQILAAEIRERGGGWEKWSTEDLLRAALDGERV